ncbi:hypothetical protein [Palleronia sp. LCG004]|uniref:hypothetical protein n=1 Tax=Palleronia sp. LCG004 TaxID=3079304 RepID=UPI00294208E1|nr:hypothetical protein [Palleronia sp. LCG004]WOI55493.1 hypothetical protein RVY76_10615 [Palleronia sp. LCG004]
MLYSRTDITPKQTFDHLKHDPVVANNLLAPSAVLADRRYDTDHIRKTVKRSKDLPMIHLGRCREKHIGIFRCLSRARKSIERCPHKLRDAHHGASQDDGTMALFLGAINITSSRFSPLNLSI